MSNNNNGNTVFDDLYKFVRGSGLSAWVMILGVVIFVFGVVTFVEDSYSSYVGIQMIEKTLGLKPATWTITYLVLSVIFQVTTIIAGLILLSNTEKYWWAGVIALLSQAVDFSSDVWYRSNGQLFENWTVFGLSAAMTLVFYTVMSEGAITFGFGLTRVMIVDGADQLGKFMRAIFDGVVALFSGFLTKPKQNQTSQKPQQQANPLYEQRVAEILKSKQKTHNQQQGELPHPYNNKPKPTYQQPPPEAFRRP